MTAIRVRDLKFRYNQAEEETLSGINFEQNRAELVVIMGATGAGKSTFSRTLNSLIPQFKKGEFSGEIDIMGQPIKDNKVYQTARNLGLVFQDFENQLFCTNVALELAFGSENLSVPQEEISERVNLALSMVGLEGYENREPHTLSGGEKQRLAIASILSMKPDILVMDEPTTDLDPLGKYHIFQIAKSLKADGVTLLIIETETEEILEADRIVIFNKGEVIVEGAPEDVLTRTSLLEQNGVRPLELVRLFEYLKIPEVPFTVEAAYSILKKRGLSISKERYELLRKEEKRCRCYGETILSMSGVKFAYNSQEILKGIDIRIRAGEFLAVLGQNGSGKTTLIKHLNGLLTSTEGRVMSKGKDMREIKTRDIGREIGYVFQNPDHQIFSDTVKEEVAFASKNYGFSDNEISQRVEEALAFVHMSGYEDKDPFSLTKGERQRLAVASVLALRPEILILDEPTTGLDYQELKSMMKLLEELNNMGVTIIIVTHTMWVVAEYVHRALVISEGKLVMDGTVREIFSDEKELEKVSLKLPPLVRLSHKFDKTLLSVEEFVNSVDR